MLLAYHVWLPAQPMPRPSLPYLYQHWASCYTALDGHLASPPCPLPPHSDHHHSCPSTGSRMSVKLCPPTAWHSRWRFRSVRTFVFFGWLATAWWSDSTTSSAPAVPSSCEDLSSAGVGVGVFLLAFPNPTVRPVVARFGGHHPIIVLIMWRFIICWCWFWPKTVVALRLRCDVGYHIEANHYNRRNSCMFSPAFILQTETFQCFSLFLFSHTSTSWLKICMITLDNIIPPDDNFIFLLDILWSSSHKTMWDSIAQLQWISHHGLCRWSWCRFEWKRQSRMPWHYWLPTVPGLDSNTYDYSSAVRNHQNQNYFILSTYYIQLQW